MKHKKRTTKILRAICLLSLLAILSVIFFGCSDSAEDSLKDNLSFDKKYYLADTSEISQKSYMVLHEDGTGEYVKNTSNGHDYTVSLKWVAVDESTVIVIDNGTTLNQGYSMFDPTAFCSTFSVTKEILLNPLGLPYVCEDFLDEIPNYGKMLP